MGFIAHNIHTLMDDVFVDINSKMAHSNLVVECFLSAILNIDHYNLVKSTYHIIAARESSHIHYCFCFELDQSCFYFDTHSYFCFDITQSCMCLVGIDTVHYCFCFELDLSCFCSNIIPP